MCQILLHFQTPLFIENLSLSLTHGKMQVLFLNSFAKSSNQQVTW
uniref:Uncharacterized protein n=1 Tax=Anguilla anguilla TaxID=7936 RepID=A0A0E9UXC2_ANGAN